MIWLTAQLWPAALLALVAGFAITWFTVVKRLDDVPASAERDEARQDRPDGGSRRAGRSSDGHSDSGRAGAGRSDAAGSRRDDPSDGLDGGEVSADEFSADERRGASRIDGQEPDEARHDVPAHRPSGSVGSAFTSRRDE